MKWIVVKSQSLLQRIIALKLPREIWETFSRKKKKKTRSCLLTWNTTRSTQQTVKDGRSWSLRLALFSELAIATRHAKSTTPTWTLEFVGFENQSAKQSTSVAPEQLEIGKVVFTFFELMTGMMWIAIQVSRQWLYCHHSKRSTQGLYRARFVVGRKRSILWLFHNRDY